MERVINQRKSLEIIMVATESVKNLILSCLKLELLGITVSYEAPGTMNSTMKCD